MNIGIVSGELIVLFSVAGVVLGLLIGVLYAHPQLSRALAASIGAIARIRTKSTQSTAITTGQNAPPMPHSDWVDSIPNKVPKADQQAIIALTQFHKRLVQHYGDDIVTIFLFGSRARGEHLANSDVDLAVLFTSRVRIGIGTYWKLWQTAFEVLLEVGLYLQPRLLQLNSPINAWLLPTIAREGLRVSTYQQIKGD